MRFKISNSKKLFKPCEMESAAQTPEYQELEQKHARHLNMLQENVSLKLFS